MEASLKEFFSNNEPEIVLESYTKEHIACFQLLDCDGYLLGYLVCEGVHLLCVTTCWYEYSDISIYSADDIPLEMTQLKEHFPKNHILVLLKLGEDHQETVTLPEFSGSPLGYIICQSIQFKPK